MIIVLQWSAYDLVHLIDDYRIGAAIINRYFNNIIPNKNDADQMAAGMLSRVKKPNKLAGIINLRAFQTEIKNFVLGDEITDPFPILTKEDLKIISMGSYQIDQMHSYCVEHIRASENHQFEFFVCPDSIGTAFLSDLVREHGIVEPILVLAELQSRFRSGTKYQTFVLADASDNSANGVLEYCCGCRHGLRTVGCCSHVMAIIRFLGFMRHNTETLRKAAAFLNDLFDE